MTTIIRNSVILVGSAVLLVALFLGLKDTPQENGGVLVKLGSAQFETEVVDTPALRMQGLSGKESLGADQAMLFVFNADDTHGFWMKDMNFPIDIIWIDKDLKVVTVAERVSPDSYPTTFRPEKNARYVLEINAGLAEQFGVTQGTLVEVSGADF